MRRVAGLGWLVLCSACGGPDKEPTHPSPPPTVTPTASATASAAPGWPADGPPRAEKKPVSVSYHGTTVVDDYRWLEDSADAAVKTWNDAESAHARRHLDRYPGRDALRARFSALLLAASSDLAALRWGGKSLFALKDQPPRQQELLVTLRDASDPKSEKVVLDPNVLDASGGTTIDWYVPSPDGSHVAVSLSKGGSESGDVHVYEVATGKEVDTPIARVHGGTAGGSLSWRKDGKGFWYTRYPRDGEHAKEDMGFYQTVWFHEIGHADRDRPSLVGGLPRIAEIELETSQDGRHVLARVANGDGGEYAFYLLDTTEKPRPRRPGEVAIDPILGDLWHRVSDFADKVVGAELGEDGGLWLRSLKGAARGSILRAPLSKPELSEARVVVPESEAVIETMLVTKGRLYVKDLVGGPSQVRVFDLRGKAVGALPLPPVTSVRQLVGKPGTDEVLVRTQSYTDPPGWSRAVGLKLEPTPLRQTSPADFSKVEVVRETCTSRDGTKVPVSILRRRGLALDGSNPTVLYGYGGYGVSIQPRFSPKYLPWIEAGGVYVLANLRGGGEFGEAWHEAGKLTRKQNVFDDFAACAEHLVSTKVTRADRLAIEGGSNGGLLMGATMVQHPAMFGAVVSHVGIYDMLRVETTPNGAFNVTEFGTVKERVQFDALLAYSPYHHVTDGAAYPPVLFLTGANDPRVDPYQSRKMTARLQEASLGRGTVLLRTSGNTGHGMGTPLAAQVEELVDVYAFLGAQLHVSYK